MTIPATSCQVSKKHVLLSEILAVTSVMRKNSRWASGAHTLTARDSALARDLGLRRSTPSTDIQKNGRLSQEADLMGGFQQLKRTIWDVDGGCFLTAHVYPPLITLNRYRGATST
jgi:brefeldin A-resistance guanine nucleotide exchange factor 1